MDAVTRKFLKGRNTSVSSLGTQVCGIGKANLVHRHVLFDLKVFTVFELEGLWKEMYSPVSYFLPG